MDEVERVKYAIKNKLKEDNMDEESYKMLEEMFSKRELADIISGSTKNHFMLIKWLYDTYPEILREFENKSGMHIHFAGKENDE